MFPQALQVRTPDGCPITGDTGAAGAGGEGAIYTGVDGEGAGGTICPALAPQIPQNFSDGDRGEPHELHTSGATGRTGTGGGIKVSGG
jgi:hypothetical protein